MLPVRKRSVRRDPDVRVAGLFAGIGGFELGLGAAGHASMLLCESWAPAQAVLKARFPDAVVHGDIRELRRLPDGIEIIAAGFPART
jgi:DNA (cytosine-5)-methyltransferase 1